MHIIVDDDQLPDQPFRIRWDLHLNANHFLPPIDHARFVLKPDFNLHSFFELLSGETGIQAPLGRTSVSKLGTEGVGKRAEKKVVDFLDSATTSLPGNVSSIEEVKAELAEKSTLLDGNLWQTAMDGLIASNSLPWLSPVFGFLSLRIQKEEQLIEMLEPVFKEDTRKIEFLNVRGWPALLKFQRDNTLKQEEHIMFSESDHRELTEEEQVRSGIEAVLHDIGDFYFSLFSNLDLSVANELHPENPGTPNSVLQPLINDYIENCAEGPFVASFIRVLKKRCEEVKGVSLSNNQLANAIGIEGVDEYDGSETIVDRRKNLLNKWRRGKGSPSPEALLLFMSRLACLVQGKDMPLDNSGAHVADELFIQMVWSLNRIFTLLLNFEHPEEIVQEYLTMEKRRAMLCNFLQHYSVHWKHWSAANSEKNGVAP